MSAAAASKAWSWRHALTKSDLPATTRHVLLTLSVCMDEAGGGCFPSLENLAGMTGYGKNTIIEHLKVAVENGWLKRGQHGYRGRRWRRSEYVACWPGRDLDEESEIGGETAAGIASADDQEAARGGSPKVVHEVNHLAGGGSPGGAEVVHEVNHVLETSPGNIPEDLRESAGAGAGKGKNAETRLPTADCRLPKAPEPKPEDDPEFQALLAGFPGIDVPSRAFRAWSGLTVAERKRAIERVPSYLAELKALRRASPHKLSTYLAEKLFDQAADPKAEPPARTMIAPRTQLWWTLFWLRKQRGEKVSFMLDMAKQNTGCAVALRDVPDAAAEALLVKVERSSADYRAIETMLRRDGLSLNDFAAGQWIWAPPSPSFAPPASPAARADDLEDML